MPVLLYAPEVQIIVSTDTGYYDVSQDIVSGSVTLTENASHQMQCTLLNKGRRYDKLFKPNDRFVLYLKRLQKLLIMTGYLDTVPLFSIWPRSVTITGSSTLKRLQYHWWDPGTAASVQLWNQNAPQTVPGTQAYGDSGMSKLATAIMTQVGGWDPSKIHFASLPSQWVNKVTALFEVVAPQLNVSLASLGLTGLVGSQNPISGGATTSQWMLPGAPAGTGMSTSIGNVVQYTGPQDIQAVGHYYFQMQWGYQNPDGSTPPTVDVATAKSFLAKQQMMVVNPSNNVGVVVVPAGWGPPTSTNAVIGLSADALQALGISTIDPNNMPQVEMAWIDVPGIAVGPYTLAQGSSSLTSTAPATSSTGLPAGTPSGIDKGAPPSAPPTSMAVPAQYGGNSPTVESPNAASAVAVAHQALGTPYGNGGTTIGQALDCSGLTMVCWAKAGVTIPRTSQEQWAALAPLPSDPTYWLPGDLAFYNVATDGTYQPGHVVIYIGSSPSGPNGEGGGPQVISAPTQGQVVQIQSLSTDPNLADYQFRGMRRVTGVNGQGVPNGQTPTTASSVYGSTPGPAPPNANSSESFVTVWDWFAGSPSAASTALTGPRALLNDVPLLPTVQNIVNASMRSFCSAPNGDFIAWFPDYFNAYGTLGVVQIEDIELQDFSIMWSDLNMVTHQFAAGTYSPASVGLSDAGGEVAFLNMIETAGVATIDFPQILQELLNIDPSDPTFSTPAIYQRFGARPNYQSLGTIVGPLAEFWYALYLFQYNWASMFNAQFPICFMPELYPGMILQINSKSSNEANGFQAYVQQVTHSWNMADGAGFTTQVTVAAPSQAGSNGLWGFAKGGSSVPA